MAISLLKRRLSLSQSVSRPAIHAIDSDWPLHYCAFYNLSDELQKLVKGGHDVNMRDPYGCTALHIALMLGHKECVDILLEHDAFVYIRNIEGWNALSEAISYGSLSLTSRTYRLMRTQLINLHKMQELQQTLLRIPDCQLQLKWELTSWVSFIEKRLPSDSCRLTKIGQCLRLDSSLIDIRGRKFIHGDLSVLFNPENEHTLVLVDNLKKKFHSIGEQANLDSDVNVLRSTELMHMRLVTDDVKWVASKNGRTHNHISGHHVTKYTLSNLVLQVVRRKEHLTSGRKHRQKAKSSKSEKHRMVSLSPPRGHRLSNGNGEYNPAPVTWDLYKSGKLRNNQIYLGRQPEIRRNEKKLKLTVEMTDELPLTVSNLIGILRVLSPLAKLQKLREALETFLPPGFPLSLEFPVFPTTTGRVVFTKIDLLQPGDNMEHTPYSGPNTSSNNSMPSFNIPEGFVYKGEFRLAKPI